MAREIPLSQGLVTVVDADYEYLPHVSGKSLDGVRLRFNYYWGWRVQYEREVTCDHLGNKRKLWVTHSQSPAGVPKEMKGNWWWDSPQEKREMSAFLTDNRHKSIALFMELQQTRLIGG